MVREVFLRVVYAKIAYHTVSTSRITKIIVLGLKLVKNYQNNSQNHLWSVNRMSEMLRFHVLQRLSKPKITQNKLREARCR